MKTTNIIFLLLFIAGLNGCMNRNHDCINRDLQIGNNRIKIEIPKTYKILPKKEKESNVEIVMLKGSNVTNTPFFMTRKHFSVIKSKEVINNNRYISQNGGFSILLPHFNTGKILIDQSEIRKGIDYQVRFYEQDVKGNIPWHAVVVSTLLPKEWNGKEKKILEIVKNMQLNIVSDLPKGSFFFSKINGHFGLLWETIIVNRTTTIQYPGSKAIILPYSKVGYKTIGINRIGYINGKLIEIGIIAVKPDDISNSEFMNYALQKMDSFHSGLKVFN